LFIPGYLSFNAFHPVVLDLEGLFQNGLCLVEQKKNKILGKPTLEMTDESESPQLEGPHGNV
jgi:hypothetical protein